MGSILLSKNSSKHIGGGNKSMNVQTSWEKLEGNEGVLTVTVSAEDVKEGLDKAFNKVVKQVNVPGFRKGKVPKMIFEQRFGVESLYQDALDFILPEAYSTAIDESGIEPVDRPDIDVDQLEKGKELVFKATVTVKPEVKLGEYKGLEVEATNTEVTEEDVKEELEQLQERYAELAVKEEGEVENGNSVILDFEGYVDGEPFEGGQAENYSLEIGSGSFIPGFEEQVVGVKTGEEKDITVTFPEEYHSEELKGKEAVFKIKVNEIKEKVLPELDDEFAKDVDDEVETLDELKTKILNRLKEQRSTEAENAKRDSVVEKATENTDIDLPDAMINSELDRMEQEFEQRMQSQGITMDMYYQFSGSSKEDLREQMKEDADKRVRANLTLEAIAAQENLEVTDEEVQEELENMSKMYNLDVEQIKQMLAMQGGDEAIKSDLKLRKAVDFLIENSTAKED